VKTCKQVQATGVMSYLGLARKYGAEYGVDPYLMLAYMKHESGFKPAIYNRGCHRIHGAMAWKYCTTGLAQLPPKYYNCPCGSRCHTSESCAEALKDPEVNIKLLAKAWGRMKKRYKTDKTLLIASNWGVGNYNCYLKGKTLDRRKKSPTYGKCIPPPAKLRQSSVRYANSIIALRNRFKSCLSGVAAPPYVPPSYLGGGGALPFLVVGGILLGGAYLYYKRKK